MTPSESKNPQPLRTPDGKIELLRRVYVPIEKRTVAGVLQFRTLDGKRYMRDSAGTIFASPKVGRNKKERRRARREAK
jgi:hypothetical protein